MAYNPIKRIRAWFFQDNIPAEPRTYTDGNGNTVTKQVKTRFFKGHFPKEETFRDLIQTTFLKSSDGDLQDVASTGEILSATDVEKVVKPNQLPELEADLAGGSAIANTTSTQNGYLDVVFEPKSRMVGSKKKWAYYFTNAFANWLFQKLVPRGGTSGQVLRKGSNADYDAIWETIPSTSGVLPAGGTTNQYLRKVNNTDYNTAWTNADWYTQTEVTTFLNNELIGRTELDARITNDATEVVDEFTYYATNNLSTFRTRLDGIDTLNGTQTTNIATNTSNITNITNGATLPASSLAGLQTQINALNLSGVVQSYTNIPCEEIRVDGSAIWYSKIGNRVFMGSYSVVKPVAASVWALSEPITYTLTLPTNLRPVTFNEIQQIVHIQRLGVWTTTNMTIFNNGMIRIYVDAAFTLDGLCNIYIPSFSYLVP